MLYAAYGSNLHPERLRQRLPAAQPVGCARVEGWRLTFAKRGQDGSGKGGLLSADDHVFVAVYRLSEHDLDVLDRIEGSGYARGPLAVRGFGPCHTYWPIDVRPDERLRPFLWYKRLVLAGCVANGFPSTYINRIRAVAHLSDTNCERRRRHTGLLTALHSRMPDPVPQGPRSA